MYMYTGGFQRNVPFQRHVPATTRMGTWDQRAPREVRTCRRNWCVGCENAVKYIKYSDSLHVAQTGATFPKFEISG